eukprot:4524080-Lingulodinium_polyedra.AAC.1
MHGRVICKPTRRRTVDSTTSSCNTCEILHNDTVESTMRRRGGLEIARSRAPRARQILARA